MRNESEAFEIFNGFAADNDLDPDNNVWADRMGGSSGWGFIISGEAGEYAQFI